MRVSVTREAADRLSCQRWEFAVRYTSDDQIAVVLTYYAPEQRATTRHKYQRLYDSQRWDARDERDYYSQIKRAAVPLPADVVAEALEQVRAAVYFQDVPPAPVQPGEGPPRA